MKMELIYKLKKSVQIGSLEAEIFAKTYFLKFGYTYFQIGIGGLRNFSVSIYKNKYNFSE
jgi:hypothetical protein